MGYLKSDVSGSICRCRSGWPSIQGSAMESSLRTRASTSCSVRSGGGMGIGLSDSRSIIKRHQGHIWAEPNRGEGGTFAFSIRVVTHSRRQVRSKASRVRSAQGYSFGREAGLGPCARSFRCIVRVPRHFCAGTAVWGAIAVRAGIGQALLWPGVSAIVSAASALFLRVSDIGSDSTPWNHWRLPPL